MTATGERKITRLSGTLGARIDGLDLARPLDPETFGWLRARFLEHHVLVFPSQDMTPDEEVAFARHWGEISVHPYIRPLEGHPEVLEVVDPRHPIARTWHQDQTYLERPPLLTMLMARVLPEAGGDTMFANQHKAFDDLSDGLQRLVLGLRAVHRGTESAAADAGLTRVQVEHAHPVAPRHPVTGRPALFVNADYTLRIEGWSEPESRPLLDLLYRAGSRAEISCRHRWSPGDFVLWDNRCVLHRVVPDATGDRVLHKVTVAGDVPA